MLNFNELRPISMLRSITVIAAVLMLAGCQALQQVDQSLYKATESVTERDRVTGKRSLSTANRQQQIAQGNKYIEQLLEEEKKAGRKINAELDKQQSARLKRIFKRIHRISHLRNENWQAVLIDRPTFNAFTTGGTYIVVHTGLMEQLSDDNEVAAVVGHEIAHTVANHLGESQTHRIASMLSGSKSARTNAYQAAFTHENEREADQVGLLYSALAGYDPYAANRIWQRQYLKQGNARALFLHSHPVNAERAAETLDVANKIKPYYQPGKQNQHYQSLLKNNVLWQYDESLAEAGKGGGLLAVLSTVTGAYKQHHNAKQEAKRQQQQAMLVKAIGQQIKRLNSQKETPHRLKVEWQYNTAARYALKKLTVGLMIKKNKKMVRVVSHYQKQVRPGQKFLTVFNLPETVNVDDLRSESAQFYLDDVELVR